MIFNLDNRGSDELFELTGVFERSISFNEVRTDIYLATETVCRFIGRETYEAIEKKYLSKEQDEIIYMLQLPIAFLALKSYFDNNTVSHGADGRKVKINAESHKLAWQWMLEADSAMLENKAYQGLDILMQHLETIGFPQWLEAPIRQKLSLSWVKTLDEFESVFPIDRSFNFFYTLLPFMLEVQHKWFKPVLRDYYVGIEQNEALSDVFRKAKEAIPLLTMITAVRRLSVSVLPDGVVRRFASSSQTSRASVSASVMEVDRFTATLLSDAQGKIDEVKSAIAHLSGELDNYPLIPTNHPSKKYMRT